MVDQESKVYQKIKVHFADLYDKTIDFKEILNEIDPEEHPVLYSFISFRAKQFWR